jgi:hypothetical protein
MLTYARACFHFTQPAPSSFGYDEAAYKKALGEFMAAAPFSKPVVLVVQVSHTLTSQAFLCVCSF